MSFVSYAQNYEDVILWRALRDVEHGFYVDVGAADPEVDSVTCAFYERGWSGINIEPLDEHFDKLTRGRPRDTNLRVAVGREAGLRALHAFPGTGLSTLDAQIGARHQAAGFSGYETSVPMLTLTKILEDCAPPTIHFLKIDVEGAEAEVLEGLNLNSVRPWVIVIEGTEPSFVVEGTAPGSQVSTRENWEYLIIDCHYGFAYFDGLNCFYVADEVASLKEQLAVPPNVFDEFVRFPEWSIQQEAAKVKQEIAGLREHAVGLEATLQAEQARIANLRKVLRVAQEQTSELRSSLQEEKAQRASLQAQMDHLRGRMHQLEAQLTAPSVDRAVGRALKRLRETGDRLSGGGLRSLGRSALTNLVQRSMHDRRLMAFGRAVLRPFPKVATSLWLAAKEDAATTSPIPSPAGSLPSDDAATVAALPASARSAYLRIKSAMSDSAWNRTQ